MIICQLASKVKVPLRQVRLSLELELDVPYTLPTTSFL